MNEAPRDMPNPRPQPQSGDYASDQAIENAALAGAAAIQRLVAERNGLRNRLGAQQREVAALRAVNEDLRRRLILIHQRYVELAKRVVGELEQVDGVIRTVAQEAHNGLAHEAAHDGSAHDGPAHWEEAAQPASLAQRLAEADMVEENTPPNGSARPRA
jgi:hypothetical protein